MKKTDAVLHVKELRVTRGGRETVNIPSFSLFSHETVTLIGPNGSGKSSFLLSLASLLQPDAGQICFKGEPLNSIGLTDYRRKLAMVFQEPLLFDTTVYKNVATGLAFRGVARREIDRQVEACLERFRITHLAGRSARKLSGGEAQRTSLARAFATNPELLLLDEPFAALDPPTRRALSDDLAQALRESGAAAIMATHDQPDALYFADRMAVMHEGRIVQTGTVASVMQQPVNEFVAAFAGIENIFSATIVQTERGILTLAIGTAMISLAGDGKPGDPITLCIRPEHVMLGTRKPDHGISGCTVFYGKIIRVLPFGLHSKVYLDCGFILVASVTDQTMSEGNLKPSDMVYAWFRETAVHFFARATEASAA